MIQKVAVQWHGAQHDPARRVRTPAEITDRLTKEFPEFDRDTVWRWVRDTLACLRHLGLGADAKVIERLTRGHLASLVGSPVQAHSSRAALVGAERSGGRVTRC